MLKKKLMKGARFAVLSAAVILSAFCGSKKVAAAEDNGYAAASYKVGTAQTGTLASSDSADWYSFTTDSSDSFYELTFVNTGVDGSGAHFTVYGDVDATEQLADDYVSYKSTNTKNLVKLSTNHTYYVKVTGTWGNTGSYKFTITKTKDDVKDSPEEAQKVKVGSKVKKAIQNTEDEDWFSFTTDSSDSFYEFSFSNTGADGYLSYTVYEDKDATKELKHDTIGSKTSRDENLVKLAKKHTYYVKVDTKGWGAVGDYTFQVTKTEDDVADTVTDAAACELNETAKYAIQNPQDTDYFQFKTTGFENYTLTFSNVSSEQLTVTIYSGKDCLDSQVVGKYYVYKKRSVSGSDQKLKLSRSKTYYIKVSGEEGTYKLGVSATSPSSVKTTSTESKEVTVKWSKLDRATGYEIYRAESKKGSYKKIATVKKASTVSYTDTKSLKKGKTYYYKVRAYVKVNGKTYYSDYSSVKSVKVK